MAENEGTTGEGTATGTSTGEGQQAPAWTAQLPESLRSNPDVTSFKSIGELGQSFLDTRGRAREFETKAQENEGKVKDYETRIASEFIPRPTNRRLRTTKPSAARIPLRPTSFQRWICRRHWQPLNWPKLRRLSGPTVLLRVSQPERRVSSTRTSLTGRYQFLMPTRRPRNRDAKTRSCLSRQNGGAGSTRMRLLPTGP